MTVKEMREVLNTIDPVYDDATIVVVNKVQEFRWLDTTPVATMNLGFDWDSGKFLINLVNDEPTKL